MNEKTFLADRILSFLSSLGIPSPLPRGVEVLNPYRIPAVMKLCQQFYHAFYEDNSPRRIIFGINPGRLGAGLTGIPFTDPVHLEKFFKIKNQFPKKTELSSTYIYEIITAFGGPERFYSRFYFSSVSPLGFTKEEKNLNYYDDARLQKKLEPFILECLRSQLDFGLDRRVAYCLGEGKNFTFIKHLNEQYLFFEKIIPLAHPRFIMQYKRKSKNEYVKRYLDAFAFTPGKGVS